ncbi:MAG: rRNA maturation RNase YbeY [Gemmatimonadaceae bacterium]
MTISVSVSTTGVRVPVALQHVERAAAAVLRAERVRAAMVSVTFVSRSRMSALNRDHLGRRGATDVIAFAFNSGGLRAIVGDVYISPDVARNNAASHRVGVREEVLRLVVHGILHVVGRDHPDNGGRERSAMWRRQEALLRRLTMNPGGR